MIYKKLLEIQKKDITVEKVGENPHFKSSYPTLNEVLSKIKKPLNDADILIIQAPEATGLRTRLLDTSDDTFVECFMPYVELSSAQKLGSNNTYNRRYSLITLLGLEDEDNDMESPKQASKAIVEPKKAATKPKGTIEYPSQDVNPDDIPF